MKSIVEENPVLTKPFAVLHIDGDMLMRRILKKTLPNDQFQLDSAANGREAFLLLEEKHYAYDIVITEMHMHFANGYEIVNKILERVPGCTVIVTSNMSFFHIGEGLDLKRENYFKKPLVIGKLMERINTIIGSEQAGYMDIESTDIQTDNLLSPLFNSDTAHALADKNNSNLQQASAEIEVIEEVLPVEPIPLRKTDNGQAIEGSSRKRWW